MLIQDVFSARSTTFIKNLTVNVTCTKEAAIIESEEGSPISSTRKMDTSSHNAPPAHAIKEWDKQRVIADELWKKLSAERKAQALFQEGNELIYDDPHQPKVKVRFVNYILDEVGDSCQGTAAVALSDGTLIEANTMYLSPVRNNFPG